MNSKDFLAKLEDIPHKQRLTAVETDEVLATLATPGIYHLLGLLKAERQGFLMQQNTVSLPDQEAVRRFGVLQGIVHGIDRLHELLVETLSPSAPAKEKNK